MFVCTLCGTRLKGEPDRRILFMRHGETTDNEKRIISGTRDVGLTRKGNMQARNAGTRLRGDFDLVVSSPLLRARQTALIFCEQVKGNPRVECDPRLGERNVGELEGMSEAREGEGVLFRYDFLPKGATPLKEFEDGTWLFLQDLEKRAEGVKRTIVVTHSFRLCTIIKLLHGWSVKEIVAYAPPANCETIEFALETCDHCQNEWFEKSV